jgi:hypothetical protein
LQEFPDDASQAGLYNALGLQQHPAQHFTDGAADKIISCVRPAASELAPI